MLKWTVAVTRIGYGRGEIEIVADNEQEAREKALDIAGDFLYTEHTSEYEVEDVTGGSMASPTFTAEPLKSSATRIAKGVKKELAASSPATRFSITTSRKGDSVRIQWMKGPLIKVMEFRVPSKGETP